MVFEDVWSEVKLSILAQRRPALLLTHKTVKNFLVLHTQSRQSILGYLSTIKKPN
jgi:hypothetical protein